MAPRGVPWPSRGVPWPLYEEYALEDPYYIYLASVMEFGFYQPASSRCANPITLTFTFQNLTDSSLVRSLLILQIS